MIAFDTNINYRPTKEGINNYMYIRGLFGTQHCVYITSTIPSVIEKIPRFYCKILVEGSRFVFVVVAFSE